MTETKLVDICNVEALDPTEAKAAFLSLYKQQRPWIEITDDPATWPPVNTVVLVDDNGIKLAFIDPASKWRAPLGTFVTKNQKIGWYGSRYRKNQRIYNWRPI